MLLFREVGVWVLWKEEEGSTDCGDSNATTPRKHWPIYLRRSTYQNKVSRQISTWQKFPAKSSGRLPTPTTFNSGLLLGGRRWRRTGRHSGCRSAYHRRCVVAIHIHTGYDTYTIQIQRFILILSYTNTNIIDTIYYPSQLLPMIKREHVWYIRKWRFHPNRAFLHRGRGTGSSECTEEKVSTALEEFRWRRCIGSSSSS